MILFKDDPKSPKKKTNILPENYNLFRPIYDDDFLKKSNCSLNSSGCANYANNRLAELTKNNITIYRDDSWFQKEHNVSHGGDLIYSGNGDDVSDYFEKLQVGDYIEFDDYSRDTYAKKKSKVNRNYKNTGSEHTAIVIGFTKNNEPIIEHYGGIWGGVKRDILKKRVNQFGHTYNPVSIYRNPDISKDNSALYLNKKYKEKWNNALSGSHYKISSTHKKINEWENIYKNEVRNKIGENYNLSPEQLDEVFKTLIGLGIQESNLDNDVFDEDRSWYSKAADYAYQGIIESSTPGVSLYKGLFSKELTKEQAEKNKEYNKKYNLKTMPHPSEVEAMFIKKIQNENKPIPKGDDYTDSLEKYVDYLKDNVYKGKPTKVVKKNTTPSVGAFKAKITANDAYKYGINSGLKDRSYTNQFKDSAYYMNKKNQLINSMLLLIEGMNDKYDFKESLDRSVIKYNSPGKERNENIMDFFYYGKGNPDPNRFNITYLKNIKDYKNKYFPKQN